ncbi:hypothetical protein SLEP1_g51783 [Rubroshorea leprosula]|uniref:Uncharacterized protein n=1 Tax=Rubroshorea leprosula TaxID=152421 RepID=A0AAV5M6X0_9ROSI|nr:hypothetical protein SLEP1_g51783 [Rubroshorea leprosula]
MLFSGIIIGLQAKGNFMKKWEKKKERIQLKKSKVGG